MRYTCIRSLQNTVAAMSPKQHHYNPPSTLMSADYRPVPGAGHFTNEQVANGTVTHFVISKLLLKIKSKVNILIIQSPVGAGKTTMVQVLAQKFKTYFVADDGKWYVFVFVKKFVFLQTIKLKCWTHNAFTFNIFVLLLVKINFFVIFLQV